MGRLQKLADRRRCPQHSEAPPWRTALGDVATEQAQPPLAPCGWQLHAWKSRDTYKRGFGSICTTGADNVVDRFRILRSVLQKPGNAAGSRKVLPWGAVAGLGAALALPLHADLTRSLQQPMWRLLTRKCPLGAALPLGTNTSKRVPGLLGGDREAVEL